MAKNILKLAALVFILSSCAPVAHRGFNFFGKHKHVKYPVAKHVFNREK